VVTGIAAIGVAAVSAFSSWLDGQKEVDRALIGIGKRAGATRGDINQMAEANAAGARLSVSEWQSGAAEFAKTGTIYKENFKGLNDLVKGFALTIGEGSGEAQKQLAKIFGGDVAGAADKLNSMYGSISGKTREYARDLEVAGKRQEAIALIVRDITPAIQQAANVTGFWAASWDAVANAASNAGSKIGKGLAAMTGIGDTPEARLERLQGTLKIAEQAFQEQQELAAKIGSQLVPGLSQASDSVMRLRAEVTVLRAQLGKADETNVFLKMGQDADDAIRKMLPYIDQLKEIDERQRKIREGQTQQHPDEGPGTQMGLSDKAKEAANAYEVLKLNVTAAAEMHARLNEYALELLRIEQQTQGAAASKNLEFLKQLDVLKDQLMIAQASSNADLTSAQHQDTINQMRQIGVSLAGATAIADAASAREARLAARHQADINEARRQGFSLADATRLADEKQNIRLAQIAEAHRAAMVGLEGQLRVAQAITGAQQIQAQFETDIVSLLEQDFSLTQAIEQATKRRAIAIAEANTEAERMLFSLRQENQLINASSDEERDRIKARQTYENLVRKNVDSSKAAAVASQQLRNAEDERARAYERMTDEQKKQADLAQMSSYNQEVFTRKAAQAQQAASAAAQDTSAWLETAAEAAERIERAMYAFVAFGPDIKNIWGSGSVFQTSKGGVGGFSQFDPKGYTSQTAQTQAATFAANAMYGEGGYTADPALLSLGFFKPIPNAQGLEKMVNAGGVTGAIGGLLGNLSSPNTDLVQSTASILSRLTDLLPDDQKVGAIQAQLGALGTPTTLAGQEMVKSLNDELKRLTEATQDNTSATQSMTDVLSPFYSSDPRRTHLGFRAFAGGGIMTQYGELPLRHYQGGGMATSPQVAVYGEGSTPEAYVPVPSGRIPVEIKTPANNNRQRPIVVNNHFHGPADQSTVAALRSTAFQQAQTMRRMMA